MKNNILFIGTGAWGTALANLLASNPNNIVKMWGNNKQEVDNIKKGKNPSHFKSLLISKKIIPTLNIDECIKDNDYIFLSVPSSVLKDVTKKVVEKINNKPTFINVAKGLDSETNDIWSRSLKLILKKSGSKLATLSGPSFAIDVVKKKPTIVDIVSENIEVSQDVANLFNHSKYFKAIPLTDEIGVELCGALKNLLAIGTGIAKENHSSINTVSAILTQGISDIRKIVVCLGGHEDTIFGLSGIGDIFLTCTSKQSRNFTFGQYLFKKGSKKIKYAQEKTVEGYTVFPIVIEIIKIHHLKLPVLESVCDVLSKKIDAKDFVNASISKMGLSIKD